ncbi:hypothetical protein D3C75_618260 [compost metagenome]
MILQHPLVNGIAVQLQEGQDEDIEESPVMLVGLVMAVRREEFRNLILLPGGVKVPQLLPGLIEENHQQGTFHCLLHGSAFPDFLQPAEAGRRTRFGTLQDLRGVIFPDIEAVDDGEGIFLD